MAIKDWKKVKDNTIDDLWEKRSSSSYHGNYEIWVYKIRNPERKIRWVFKIKKVGGRHSNKQFKTKSQAIREAKRYMRSH